MGMGVAATAQPIAAHDALALTGGAWQGEGDGGRGATAHETVRYSGSHNQGMTGRGGHQHAPHVSYYNHVSARWINASPPAHAAFFESPLSPSDQILACKMAHSFEHGHCVSVVCVHPSVLHWRSLAAIVDMIPELAYNYGRLSGGHQMKTVVFVDNDVEYKTPTRAGSIRIKRAGQTCNDPHICFTDAEEAVKFRRFGSATLAIVVQRGGVLGTQKDLMWDLARMIKKDRIESVLVVSTDKTPQDDWKVAHDIFGWYGSTVGYREISSLSH